MTQPATEPAREPPQQPDPTAPITPAPEMSLGGHARRGLLWSVGSMATVQVSTLLAQIVVGRVLTTEFALNGIVTATLVIANSLRDAGIRKIVVAGGEANFARLARPMQQLNIALNVIVALTLVAIAPLLANHAFKEPQPKLVPMMVFIAVSFVVWSLGSVHSARLAIQLRFRALAALGTASGVLRSAVLAGCALGNWREISFVLPMVVCSVFDTISVSYLAGRLPKEGGRLTLALARDTLLTSRWLLLAMFAAFFVYRSDTLLISRLGDFASTVTFYSWAVAISFSALSPFTSQLQSVMMPVFTRISEHAERGAAAFLRATGFAVVCGCLCFLGCLFATAPAIHLIWHGKWDPAIPVVLWLLAMLVPKGMQACALAIDEAAGRFRIAAWLQVWDGATTALFAIAACSWRSGPVLAAAITIHHYLFCTYHTLNVGRRLNTPIKPLLSHMLAPFVIACIAGGATFGVARLVSPGVPYTSIFFAGWAGAAMLLFAGLLYVIRRDLALETFRFIVRR